MASAIALAGTACGPRPLDETPGRGLLVIAIDALRADHVPSLGYDRPTMPVLDGIGAQGALFLDAWSSSPEILPAHAAILTGCDPQLARRPGAVGGGPATDLSAWFVPDGVPSLAQELLANGFETAAFADHPALAPIRGIAQGFQEFQGLDEGSLGPELGFDDVAKRFENWLSGRTGSADWFAYLHTNDLERVWRKSPLDPRWETHFEPRAELAAVPPVAEAEHAFFAVPRRRWAGGSKSLGEYEARYDGALKQLDMRIGRLLGRLRQSGRLEHTTVVVLGTCGLPFGEGGLYLDTGGLTSADLRVPIAIRPGKAPGADAPLAPRGVRVAGLASLTDVAPTLLELLGCAVPPGMQGVSHAGAMRGGADAGRAVAFASGGFQRGTAAIDARWIWARQRAADAPSAVLARTWAGSEASLRDDPVESATSRADGSPAPDAERARLAQASRAWQERLERMRRLLHGSIALDADPEMADELRRNGMLPGPR